MTTKSLGPVVSLVLVVGCLWALPAGAGNGTSGSPWENDSVEWKRPVTPTWTGRIYQDIKTTTSSPTSFWNQQPVLAEFGTVIYLGIQRDGVLFGSQPGAPGSTAKSALFSLSGLFQTTMKRLDTVHCSPGFDSSSPDDGISCSRPYSWTNGVQYRLSVDILISSNQTTCPTSSWIGSGAACLLYIGYIGLTSNPFVRTEIARWSADPEFFGDVARVSNFVEDFSAPLCDQHPRAEFMLPFFRSGSTDYPSPDSWSFGDILPADQDCGRSYEIPYGVDIKLVTES